MKKLKIMIADMSKYINTLREKGRSLFNSYLALKKHLEELRYTIDKLERENNQKKEIINQVRNEMESWKSKARDLQGSLDDLKSKYRDLEQEHKDGAQKQVKSRENSYCVLFSLTFQIFCGLSKNLKLRYFLAIPSAFVIWRENSNCGIF